MLPVKKLNVLAAPAASEIRSAPTPIGTVIEDLKHVHAHPKIFGDTTHSFAARG